MLFGECVKCNGKNSMTVFAFTLATEILSKFSKNPGKRFAKAGKRMAVKILISPQKALEVKAEFDRAAVSINSKADWLTVREVINFYQTGKGLFLGKFLWTIECYKVNPSSPLAPSSESEKRLSKELNDSSSF